MFKNYLTTAWRSLLKNKLSTLVNIGGLSIGMTIVILIGLYIWDEVSFDHYHENHRRLAQILTNQRYNGETYTMPKIAVPAAGVLRNEYAGAFQRVALVSRETDRVVAAGGKQLSQPARWVQPDFPEMFTLGMIEGRRDALIDPSAVLISESLASALFDQGPALEKIIQVDGGPAFRVGGVYANLPANTSFSGVQLLLPWQSKFNETNTSTDWENHKALLFVQSRGGQDESKLNRLISRVPSPHIQGIEEELLLLPIDRLHLYSTFENGQAVGGRIGYLRLFGIIGIFVLLLACINFMNLSTARSERRAREVAIRKTLGSDRRKLVVQFWVESIVVALFSFLAALVLARLLLPFFSTVAQKELALPVFSGGFWVIALGFTLLTGVVAGSYPALYLSRFRPVRIFRGSFKAGRFTFLFRRTLVILQFTVSICLSIGTIVVYRQIQFAKARPAGYSPGGLLTVAMNTPDLRNRFDAIRNELLGTGAVVNMAGSSYPTTHFDSDNGMDWEGRDPHQVQGFRNVNVTRDFGSTIGWNVVGGRDFSRAFGGDSAGAILNESAAKVMGFADPIGKWLRFDGRRYTVVGVVRDMITQSPYEPAYPSVFFCGGWLSAITIRVNPAWAMDRGLAAMGPVFRKYNPFSPFVFSFNDEDYGRKFADEERTAKLASAFALTAILISCLGLFGLASFLAEQRTKEIGVRKVLGAGVLTLWALLSKEFLKLTVWAILVAVPIAWYGMHRWLENYDYHAPLSGWIFFLAAAGMMLITLAAVSYQSLKAAFMNPVDSLRSE